MVGNEFGVYEDIKELRKKAIRYYKTNLQGTNVWNQTLAKMDADGNGKVEFTSEGRDKVKSNSAKEDTLLLIKYLPTLIAGARHIESKEAMSEKHKKLGDSFYYLYIKHEMNGKIFSVEITLKKLYTGNIHYYNHTIESETKIKCTGISEN